jgi:hypothetical protein
VVETIERDRRQGLSGLHRFHQPFGLAVEEVQGMTVMILASVLGEKIFKHFWPFPMGRQ